MENASQSRKQQSPYNHIIHFLPLADFFANNSERESRPDCVGVFDPSDVPLDAVWTGLMVGVPGNTIGVCGPLNSSVPESPRLSGFISTLRMPAGEFLPLTVMGLSDIVTTSSLTACAPPHHKNIVHNRLYTKPQHSTVHTSFHAT